MTNGHDLHSAFGKDLREHVSSVEESYNSTIKGVLAGMEIGKENAGTRKKGGTGPL